MHKRKRSKEKAFTSGTLNFSRIKQAHEGNLLSLAVLQREPSYLFLFTRWSFSSFFTESQQRTSASSISGGTTVAGSEQQGGGKPWPALTRIGLGSFVEAYRGLAMHDRGAGGQKPSSRTRWRHSEFAGQKRSWEREAVGLAAIAEEA